jgi:glycosyltransferase involved in cell wall biosynthesis
LPNAQNPKASVIVPNYNHARFLRQRIDCTLAQTFKDFELILLDDDSKDESLAILRGYACEPSVRLESNTVNSGGPFNQWNKGVRLAKGEYIWIAESDDYADTRLLERLVRVLDENAAIGYACRRSWNVTEHGNHACKSSHIGSRFADQFCALRGLTQSVSSRSIRVPVINSS